MLKNVLKQMEKLAEWVKKLQHNKELFTDLYLDEKERRLCPRFNCSNILATIGSETYPLRNISLTGCFVETGVSYPQGAVIDMHLNIGTGIPCRAVVRHSTITGIGVEFAVTDSGKEKELLSYVADFFLASAKRKKW